MAHLATANQSKTFASRDAALSTASRWKFRGRFGYLITAILALMLLAFIYVQLAYVSGVEINNQTWQLRRFSFYRDPLTNFQLTGLSHDSTSDRSPWKSAGKRSVLDLSIANHLRRDFDLPASWDLVAFENRTTQASASVLVELLTAVNSDYKPFWTNWSKQHPDHAAVFWPVVQDLAVANMYAYLPPLFELPLSDLSELSINEFRADLSRYLQKATLERARMLSREGNSAAARQIAELGLRYGDDKALRIFLEQLAPDG